MIRFFHILKIFFSYAQQDCIYLIKNRVKKLKYADLVFKKHFLLFLTATQLKTKRTSIIGNHFCNNVNVFTDSFD